MLNVENYDNVFDALADTPAQAANLKARSELLSALKARVRAWSLSQELAAARLGITRPRLKDLLQGKMAKFSLDALVDLATASGLTVHIQVAEGARVAASEYGTWNDFFAQPGSDLGESGSTPTLSSPRA